MVGFHHPSTIFRIAALLFHQHPRRAVECAPPALTFIVLAFFGELEVQIRPIEGVAETHGRFAAVEIVRFLDVQVAFDAVGSPDFMRAVVEVVPCTIFVEIEPLERGFGICEPAGRKVRRRLTGTGLQHQHGEHQYCDQERKLFVVHFDSP